MERQDPRTECADGDPQSSGDTHFADLFRELEKPDGRPEVVKLLATIKTRLPELESLLEEASSHWGYEDHVYRFYHQSFEVYHGQPLTERIVSALRSLCPERPLNDWFQTIVDEGTGKRFEPEHNDRWLRETRPILEASFHARYFLEMVVRYGRELDTPPRLMPSGWAAVRHLYGLR